MPLLEMDDFDTLDVAYVLAQLVHLISRRHFHPAIEALWWDTTFFLDDNLLKHETKNEKILRWSLQGGRRPYIRAVLKTGESLESLLGNRS